MRGDTLIGIFKLAKSAALLVFALTGISLLNFRIRDEMMHRIVQLSGDAHFRALSRLARMLGVEPDRKIVLFSIGAFLYAAVFAAEGVGLLMEKRWAEYFTAIVTASFIPIEVYEIVRRMDSFKVAILGVNLAVLIYLIWKLNAK